MFSTLLVSSLNCAVFTVYLNTTFLYHLHLTNHICTAISTDVLNKFYFTYIIIVIDVFFIFEFDFNKNKVDLNVFPVTSFC